MILIIGGESSIGKAFCSYLKKKSYKVLKSTRKITNNKTDTFYFNLNKPQFEKVNLKKIKVAYVFVGISNIKFCENNKKISNLINFINTRKMIKTLTNNNIRVFFISTSKVFGIVSKFPTENSIKFPQNYYALLKSKIENEFNKNKKVVILRIGKVLTKDFFKNVSSKNLTKNGNYKLSRDYYISPIYINNLCYLLLRLKNYKKIYGILNICSNDSISYYQLYHFMKEKKLINKKIIIKKNYYKFENNYKDLMSTKKIKELGFKIFSSKSHLNRLFKNHEV